MVACMRARCWGGWRSARPPGARSASPSSAAASSRRSTSRRRCARRASASSASPTSRPGACASASAWRAARAAPEARAGGDDLADRRRRRPDRRAGRRGRDRGDGRCARRASSTRCWRSRHGRHVVMVNVEADALVGPLLARRAAGRRRRLHARLRRSARADLRARRVGAAERIRGRVRRQGHQAPARLPRGHARDACGSTTGCRRSRPRGLNAQMFCSFLDGTKSAVEMAAVANATGLVPQARGLGFPPCGTRRARGAAAPDRRRRRARPQRHARGGLEPARRTARP